MPRVVNGALGTFFLVVLAPVVTALDGKDTHVQVAIVLFTVPFLLVAVMCLSSALRPGSVARGLRRLRRRRSSGRSAAQR